MTTSITPYSGSRRRTLLWPNLAKKMVLKQLEKLHSGELVLVDGDEHLRFGHSEDGVYAELHVHDVQTYTSILTGGSIGAAEAYMTGDWTTPNLTNLVRLMVRNMDVLDQMEGGLARISRPVLKWLHYLNQNSEKGSKLYTVNAFKFTGI